MFLHILKGRGRKNDKKLRSNVTNYGMMMKTKIEYGTGKILVKIKSEPKIRGVCINVIEIVPIGLDVKRRK